MNNKCNVKRGLPSGRPFFTPTCYRCFFGSSLAAMDITVKRNAYGRQLGSFQTVNEFKGIGKVPMTFIRAPYIERVSETDGVEILAKVDGNIVAVRQKNMLVTAFHPELTEDNRVHQYFLSMVIKKIEISGRVW